MSTLFKPGWLLLILLLITSCVSTNQHYNPYLSHHEKGGFRNTQVSERMKKRGMMRWLHDVVKANEKDIELSGLPKTVPYDLEKIYNPDPSRIQVTWIGHATFLIQVHGHNFLTDPMLSKRASPVQFIGPERYIPTGISISELPPIDYVLISHNHYDHLDVNTIRMLGNSVTYLVPLGLKSWFNDKGITSHVIEKDWWDTVKLTGFNITLVPAQHFSGRMLLDLNETLWGGWVVQKKKKAIYFAGDTGYNSRDFKEIGKRLGPIDLSFIPIGAYSPREVLKYVHVGPRDAVRIHEDVGSRHSIGMHWGTFRLTTEPFGEPKQILQKVLKEKQIPSDTFSTMMVGETRVY